MTEALTPGTGLAVLHLFCKATPLADTDAVLVAAQALRAPGHEIEADEHQLVSVALLGHKADVGFLALGPDLWRLRQFQTDIEAAGLSVVDSYLSLTELSEYAAGLPDERKQARLFPQLPPDGKPAFCFYPMSKRRGEADNWYTLPYERPREADVRARRAPVARSPAGCCSSSPDRPASTTTSGASRCSAVRPDDLKDCVYTMRFDEASSRFAEFGSFYTGVVAELREVLTAVGVRD